MLRAYKKKILIKFAFSYPKKNSTDVWTLTLFSQKQRSWSSHNKVSPVLRLPSLPLRHIPPVPPTIHIICVLKSRLIYLLLPPAAPLRLLHQTPDLRRSALNTQVRIRERAVASDGIDQKCGHAINPSAVTLGFFFNLKIN